MLANQALLDLRRMIHAERTVDKIKRNPNLPLNEGIITHPQKRLKSRHPIWDLTFLVLVLVFKTSYVLLKIVVNSPSMVQIREREYWGT